jgi:hypothetical protein
MIDYLDGFKWEAPYSGAGPPTPPWVKTPASVGQEGKDANDPQRRESNVLGGDYKYPDYARKHVGTQLQKLPQFYSLPVNPRPIPQLWVGSPGKFLPPDGDYPGGSTGIPEDGYIAYETGYANDGPFHGELAPMQEAGIASARTFKRVGMLSILDPGSQPPAFNDWDLGNFGAPLDNSYRPEIWDNPDKQPIDWINAGKLTCVMGGDCHDNTHQGGLHDNGNQYYDNFFTGSIDPNSDKSVNPEYARKQRILRAMANSKP